MDSTVEDVRLMRHRSHVLHTLLEGFVQRRSHDVLYRSLPQKEEFIILVKLSPIQKELYLAFMEAIGAMNSSEKPNPLRTFAMCCKVSEKRFIKVLLEKISNFFFSKIWNHPDVLYDYLQNKDLDIDLDLPDMKQQTPLLKQRDYGNTYYENSGSLDGFSPFSYQTKVYNDDWAYPFMNSFLPGILSNGSKFAIAFTIIEESIKCGDKILLFSQSLLTLNLIEKFLSKMNVPHVDQKWEKNKNYFSNFC
jgi:RAD54-like protein 2